MKTLWSIRKCMYVCPGLCRKGSVWQRTCCQFPIVFTFDHSQCVISEFSARLPVSPFWTERVSLFCNTRTDVYKKVVHMHAAEFFVLLISSFTWPLNCKWIMTVAPEGSLIYGLEGMKYKPNALCCKIRTTMPHSHSSDLIKTIQNEWFQQESGRFRSQRRVFKY